MGAGPEDLFRGLSLDLLAELALAILLGGIVGLERELRDKPAGLRTHILICMGAALFANLSHRMALMGGDPGRLAGHIVAGVGFIGAGTILHTGSSVTGLTTAANIWAVAAIGMTLGFGGYLDATAATLLVVVVLTGLSRVERSLDARFIKHRLLVTLPTGEQSVLALVTPVLEAVARAGRKAHLLDVHAESDRVVAHIEVQGGLAEEALVKVVLDVPGVRGARRA